MRTKIFINLAVKDLNKSKEFFEKLGYTFNPQFTDDTGACLVISDEIYAMLLTHPKFKEFTQKEIVDTTKNIEVITALSFESREKVEEMMTKVLDAGGTEVPRSQDYDFMFLKAFEDLDGHTWEIFWMDESKIK